MNQLTDCNLIVRIIAHYTNTHIGSPGVGMIQGHRQGLQNQHTRASYL